MDHSNSFIDRLEEMLISGILGMMALITFANFVARYGFKITYFGCWNLRSSYSPGSFSLEHLMR